MKFEMDIENIFKKTKYDNKSMTVVKKNLDFCFYTNMLFMLKWAELVGLCYVWFSKEEILHRITKKFILIF